MKIVTVTIVLSVCFLLFQSGLRIKGTKKLFGPLKPVTSLPEPWTEVVTAESVVAGGVACGENSPVIARTASGTIGGEYVKVLCE